MDQQLQRAEQELAQLQAARDALAASIPQESLPPSTRASAAPRRRRRRRTEMDRIRRRVQELHREDPSQQPADIWRLLISEGLLDVSSHDRDTVSKIIRMIDQGDGAGREMGVDNILRLEG